MMDLKSLKTFWLSTVERRNNLNKPVIGFKLLCEGARLPQRATRSSGAFDFYAPRAGAVQPGKSVNIPVGVAHQLLTPEDSKWPSELALQGLVLSRSGLATKSGIRLFYEGLVDHDYRGEIHICIENTSRNMFLWAAGDRLCQMLYIPCWMGDGVEITELDETERGTGGFGSTGR